MVDPNGKKEKQTSFGTGIFCALAGIAVGIAGKFLYDEVTKEEREEQETRATLARNRREQNKVKYENLEIDNGNITEGFIEYESFLCPISQELMKDPVITPRGISFERKSILDWLKKNRTCPITKTSLNEKDLITNYSLKNAIDEYYSSQKNKK